MLHCVKPCIVCSFWLCKNSTLSILCKKKNCRMFFRGWGCIRKWKFVIIGMRLIYWPDVFIMSMNFVKVLHELCAFQNCKCYNEWTMLELTNVHCIHFIFMWRKALMCHLLQILRKCLTCSADHGKYTTEVEFSIIPPFIRLEG